MKYTQGPWLNDFGTIRKDFQASSIVIARVSGPKSEGPDWEIQGANARLIAAAPELLEALRSVRRWVDPMDLPNEVMKEVNAAIDKATGQ